MDDECTIQTQEAGRHRPTYIINILVLTDVASVLRLGVKGLMLAQDGPGTLMLNRTPLNSSISRILGSG